MPRADLLALTDDDLTALTNRGTVKRARKEFEDEPKCAIRDEGGAITVEWPTGITCRFPSGKTIHDAVCSSGVLGITRHIVRSVMAYRVEHEQTANLANKEGSERVPTSHEVWDPGRTTDDELQSLFKKPLVVKARARFEQGIIAEATRGAKPTVRFLDEACIVRFPVPGDLRYAAADCAEAQWPLWICLAVWTFRELPGDQIAGLVVSRTKSPSPPADLFRDWSDLVGELIRDGLAGLSPTWRPRMIRVETRMRDLGFVWIAEATLELALQTEMYASRDARFDSDEVVTLIGETLARMRAAERGKTSVPRTLILGSKSNRSLDVDTGRFVGAGLGVRFGRKSMSLHAFLQDVNSGEVVAVERTFPDPPVDSGLEPKGVDQLATSVLVRGVSIGGLAVSQLLLKSGKKTPGGQLILPRAAGMTTHPQNFDWESAKPPFAAEGFAQIAARFRFLPPSYLRPRRTTENLHGVAVRGVDGVRFDSASQRLFGELIDAAGDRAMLEIPYHGRCAPGFESTAASLFRKGERLRFICGAVRSTARGLIIQPTLLIFEENGRRFGVVPYLESQNFEAQSHQHDRRSESGESEAKVFLSELKADLAEAVITGLIRDESHMDHFAQRLEQSRRLGYIGIADAVGRLATELKNKKSTLRWEAARAIALCQDLYVILRIAMDL